MNAPVDFVPQLEILENIRRIERRIEDCARNDHEMRRDLGLALTSWKILLAQRRAA